MGLRRFTNSQPNLESDPNAHVCMTGINEAFYNNIYLSESVDLSLINDELLSLRKNYSFPLTVWIEHQGDYENTTHTLQKSFQTPGPFHGMEITLEGKNFNTGDINIIEVGSKEHAKCYAEIYCEVFGFQSMEQLTIDWLISQLDDRPDALSYIAYVDGNPAGISSLMINKDETTNTIGGLYNACVREPFRKRGIGTAMAQHRLKRAVELGMNSVSIMLMSSGMARGYCLRSGFKNVLALTPFII